MILTIVGLAILLIATMIRVRLLNLMLQDVRDTAAAAIDAQTTLYIKLHSRLKAIEYPRYLGTVAGSENRAQDAACEGIDPVWGEHDAAVAEALTQAQTPAHRSTGAINTDPNSSAFFEEI